MRWECRERFSRRRLQWKPLFSDLGIYHGRRVTHVPWCMSGSLTRGGGENVPGIPGACTTHSFTYLAHRGPYTVVDIFQTSLSEAFTCSLSFNWKQIIISLCNGLVPNRWQVIILTSCDFRAVSTGMLFGQNFAIREKRYFVVEADRKWLFFCNIVSAYSKDRLIMDFAEVCHWWPNSQYESIGLKDVLAPTNAPSGLEHCERWCNGVLQTDFLIKRAGNSNLCHQLHYMVAIIFGQSE